MQAMGIRGVARVRKIVATNPDPARPRPEDKVYRLIKAGRPNLLRVGDFTEVPARSATVHAAFAIDLFARLHLSPASARA
jgi:hypothetical protein